MVCLGNICRSPLAEGVLKNIVNHNGHSHLFHIDSAGTANYHVGDFPDHRSRQVAINHGFSLNHKGRQFTREDFKNFDHILVMDESNLENVLKLARTEDEQDKVHLITKYDPRPNRSLIVPDPYYGDIDEFNNVYEQLVICCEGFIDSLKKY
jgi:protein-tyrosine phosphatase